MESLPKKDDSMPKTTLTQRRNQISSGAKKLTKEKLDHSDSLIENRGSVIKVVIWILIVVIIGIGAALLLTNVLNDSGDDVVVDDEPTSYPDSYLMDDDTDDLDDMSDDLDDSDDMDDDITDNTDDLTTDDDDTDTTGDTDDSDMDDSDDTTTPTGTTVNTLEEYSTDPRTLTAGISSDHLTLNKFRYFAMGKEFNYVFEEVGTSSTEIAPEIKAYYDDSNNLIIEIHNLARDYVTGQNNSTSRTITDIPKVTGTSTENDGNMSTYKFLLTEKVPYRVLIDNETNEITIQLQIR